MQTKLMTITPEIAKIYLGHNTDNRKKRGWWVSSLASMIKRNEWIVTHQGVAFSRSGRLLDGQHRLEAVIESNIPVDMLVVTDVSDEAFKVIDSGVKRTLSDLTGMNPKTSEVCRLLSRLALNSHGPTSSEQALSIYNCGVGEIHDNLVEYCGKNIAVLSSAPVRAAAVCLIMDGHNQQAIKEMYANLCNQQFKDLPNVAHSLLRQVSENKVTAHNKPDLLARSLKVFNPDHAGTTRLQVSEAEIAAANTFVRNIIRNALAKKEI